RRRVIAAAHEGRGRRSAHGRQIAPQRAIRPDRAPRRIAAGSPAPPFPLTTNAALQQKSPSPASPLPPFVSFQCAAAGDETGEMTRHAFFGVDSLADS